jgi:Na+-transporting methylmalonyl-CoA/oxaloacetate decarboxylase gamma subunit
LSDFQSGLLISVVGLLTTFIALLVFIGVMVILQKLFPVKEEEPDQPAIIEKLATEKIEVKTESNAEEIVAAVAAVAYLRAQRAGQLGASLLSGPGPYRAYKMIDKTN